MTKKYLYLFAGILIGGLLSANFGSIASFAHETQQALNIFNTQNNRVARLGPQPEGQGALFIFDADGHLKAQLGSYGKHSEKGQSLFALHDKNNHIRFLARLHGQKDSPVIVMKDQSGMDKMVFGLDGQTQQAFFKYIDENGQTQHLIPQY